MMRNKTLAIAIAATLSSFSMTNVVYAAATFQNGDDTTNNVIDCAAPTATGCPLKAGPIVGAGTWDPPTGWGFVRSDPNDGICFCAELFGSGSSSTALPSGNSLTTPGEGVGEYLTAVYSVDGDIDDTFLMTFTLNNGATFAAAPKLSIADNANPVNYQTALDPQAGSFTVGDNAAIFSVQAASDPLTTNDKLALLYRIQDADVLATPGSKIEMTATLQTDGLEVKVNPERTVQVATSKQCLSVALSQETLGTVHISVSEESKKFSGENPPGGDGAYVSDSEVVLGKIEITQTAGCKTSNGVDEWDIGKHTDTQVVSESSLLTVSKGQFSASVNDPGDVFLEGVSTGATAVSTISATTITADEASWELTDTNLEDIANDSANAAADVQIRFKVDGNTEITSDTDDNPTVSLTIDYEEDSIVDLTVDPVDLRRFRKDGTVCRVFGITSSESALNQDSSTIHIINQSSDTGLVRVSLNHGGYLVGPNQVVNGGNNLAPYGRLYLFVRNPAATPRTLPQEVLEDYMTVPMPAEGRGWLEVTSDLPDLDVYHVIRTGSIATNLSSGVTGSGCVD